MKEQRLRVLVVDSDPDRIQLLEEAFGEMEELRFAKPAYPACTRDYALDWREAVESLRRVPTLPPDVLLLNISTDCGPSPASAFAALRSAAPRSAIVLVASRQDEQAALALIRMGAQDYLLDTEIDCAPLGRLLRCAVERSRLDWSRASVSMVDDLTGLLNLRGVALLAERDERLAALLHLGRWTVEASLNLPLAIGADEDLLRLELAEQLTDLAAATGWMAGRTGDGDFVLAGLTGNTKAAAGAAEQAAARLHTACRARGLGVHVRVGAVNPVALCENR
jgi:DNA-binding NarL/FixJ family response regulator